MIVNRQIKLIFACLILPVLVICLLSGKANSQSDVKAGNRIVQLSIMLSRFHVKPRLINDSLSKDVFNSFIETADPEKIFFTQQDIENLSAYKYLLDDEMKSGKAGFLEAFVPVYKQRLNGALHIIDEISSYPFDLIKSDTLCIKGPKAGKFPADSNAQQQKWKAYLKMAVLDAMFDSKDLSDTITNLDISQLIKLEPALRERVRKKEQRRISNILDCPQGIDEFCISLCLDVIARCYDPHSSYFSPEAMKMFESEVASYGYMFGFAIAENKAGKVYISGIVPGGPAWKSNQLNKGDVLTSMQWKGNNPVDLSFASAAEIGDMLSSSVNKELLLGVRKADGHSLTVTLVKEKMRSQENVVKSYILDGDKKTGYICLPDFYSDNENNTELGCANDVAKEIMKLRKEGIEGLILDLRYNGGGAVREAVDLTGIFIEAGPVCIFNSRTDKAYTLKDMNIGTAFDGPVLLMVNEYSASASEIVAGALQDYHRALIVGTTTYGKATGQAIFPLDTSVKAGIKNFSETECKSGYVKVTTDQVYRITGNSHQGTGVHPDIILPDPYYDKSSGEKAEPFSFPNDRIEKKTYYTALPVLPIDTLTRLSRNRIKNSTFLNLSSHLCDSLNNMPDRKYIVTDLNSYRKKELLTNNYFDMLDSIADKTTAPYTVTNNAYDKELLGTDSYFKSVNNAAIERMKDDVLLMEAYDIMKDLIQFTKK